MIFRVMRRTESDPGDFITKAGRKMPDNLNRRQPEDAKKINLNQPYEVRDWCDKFNCTEEELEAVTKKFKNNAEKVEEYLRNNGH